MKKKEKETFYFTHDFGARNDPKLQKVVMLLGQEGIGVFWGVIEMLNEQGGMIEIENINAIAFQMHVATEVVEKLVNNFDLFKKDETFFWSESVNRRLQKREEISKGRRNSALKRWGYKTDENQDDTGTEGATTHPKGEDTGEATPKAKDIDFDAIVDMYHATCKSYPRIVKLDNGRKNKIRIRLQEMENNLDTLQKIFVKTEQSKFMRGDNKQGWKATFDWIFMNSTHWVKILEGKYDNNTPAKASKETNKANSEWE